MEIIQEIGAYAGLAAIVGLAVLSALYFSQARDVRRLREWAGRAPERSTGQMGRPPVPAQPASAPRPAVRPAQPATRPVQPAAAAAAAPAPAAAARPAAATAAGKQAAPAGVAVAAQANAPPPPVTGAPQAGASGAEAGREAAEASPTAQVATATAPAEARPEPTPGAAERPETSVSKEEAEARPETPAEGDAAPPQREEAAAVAGAEPGPTAAGTSAEPRSEVAAPPAGEDTRAAEPGGEGALDGPPAPAAQAPTPVPSAEAPPAATGSPGDEDRKTEPGPAQGAPARVGVPGAAPPLPAPVASPRAPSRTAVLPPYPGTEREGWNKRVFGEPRYAVLGIVGVLVVGAAAAFGISEVAKEEAPPPKEQRSAAAGPDAGRAEKTRAPVSPGQVTVAVLNGTTVPGLAAQIGDKIEGRGFQLGNITNSTDQQRNESVVLYAPGHERDAAMVSRRLGVAQREPIDPESQALGGDATVVVIAGADQTR